MKDVRTMPKAYESPKLNTLGSFSGLTLSAAIGRRLDQTFQDDTPVEQLTFS